MIVYTVSIITELWLPVYSHNRTDSFQVKSHPLSVWFTYCQMGLLINALLSKELKITPASIQCTSRSGTVTLLPASAVSAWTQLDPDKPLIRWLVPASMNYSYLSHKFPLNLHSFQKKSPLRQIFTWVKFKQESVSCLQIQATIEKSNSTGYYHTFTSTGGKKEQPQKKGHVEVRGNTATCCLDTNQTTTKSFSELSQIQSEPKLIQYALMWEQVIYKRGLRKAAGVTTLLMRNWFKALVSCKQKESQGCGVSTCIFLCLSSASFV